MKKINILLLIIICLGIFITFYKHSEVPGCINADEAAFGYNTYSILKTLKDEHGALLPLRLLSFNDMKLPLYSYLSIPAIAVFGLTPFATRLVGNIAGILLIPLVFYLSLELFRNRKAAYVAAFLAAVSPWIYVVSRHAHETGLSALFIGTSIWMLLRFMRTKHYGSMIFSLGAIFLATFSYHSARLFLLYIVGACTFLLFKNFEGTKKIAAKQVGLVLLLLFVLLVPFLVDKQYGTSRVGSLFFTHNAGFQLKLDEYLRENPNRILHNKGAQAIKEMTYRYLHQISPEFLAINGDANPRFGMEWLSPITPVEYLFLFIGIFYLFKNRVKNRFIITSFLLLAPLNNALTWSSYSLTRTYVMILPILIISSYGFVELFNHVNRQPRFQKLLLYGVVIGGFAFFNISSLNLYFNHYFKRAYHTRSWQCGYKELVASVKNTYATTDQYYFTKRHGQPYIYLLYFMQYDPASYHNKAVLSSPDEYGFSQVESFDKFIFEVPSGTEFPENSVVVGYPDEFEGRNIDKSRIQKITYGNEEIFWVYTTE